MAVESPHGTGRGKQHGRERFTGNGSPVANGNGRFSAVAGNGRKGRNAQKRATFGQRQIAISVKLRPFKALVPGSSPGQPTPSKHSEKLMHTRFTGG